MPPSKAELAAMKQNKGKKRGKKSDTSAEVAVPEVKAILASEPVQTTPAPKEKKPRKRTKKQTVEEKAEHEVRLLNLIL